MDFNIELTSNDYNNYRGKLSCAMISASSENFTIIFQDKDAFNDANLSSVTIEDKLPLPLLMFSYEDIIHDAVPNVRILFNKVINIESILTGYIIGKMFRKEDINKYHELFNNHIDDILNNEDIINELEPLANDAKGADDFDFSQLEDQMYEIIDTRLNELLH